MAGATPHADPSQVTSTGPVFRRRPLDTPELRAARLLDAFLTLLRLTYSEAEVVSENSNEVIIRIVR